METLTSVQEGFHAQQVIQDAKNLSRHWSLQWTELAPEVVVTGLMLAVM